MNDADKAYYELLTKEREKLIRQHTWLVENSYTSLTGGVWTAVKRLNREIRRLERWG